MATGSEGGGLAKRSGQTNKKRSQSSSRRKRPTAPSYTYADSGVNLEAADTFVGKLGPLVRKTYGPRVLASHGAFAGLFRLDYDEKLFKRNYTEPVLVGCTDGVGSKLLLAIDSDRLDTVGIDLVAMNVNDLLCSGAEPLFFLDYLAVNQLDPDRSLEIVKGIARGCELADCALLGGETAELPDLYRPRHFDLAGFAVGVVERKRLLDSSDVRPGDVLIGLQSDGLHSNGYALVRRVLLDKAGMGFKDEPRGLGEPLGDALLRPTRIYVRPVLDLLRRYQRKTVVGMAHITGGGIAGNVLRMLPDDCDAVITRGAWNVPPIFSLLQRCNIDEEEMYRVFNMGLGFVMAIRPTSVTRALKHFEQHEVTATVVGKIKRGQGKVELR